MIRFSRPLLLALLFAVGATAYADPVTVVPLNDTGQSLCLDSVGGGGDCATVADDGRYGRDAAVAAGVLTPSSSGTKGFDFTKIANDGSALASSAALGSNPTDWACTKDNVTGLTWEVKTTDGGLHDFANTYTWYSTANNGGTLGTANGGICPGSTNCDTEKFVAAVNASNAGTGLCGATDWRLPSLRELQSLVDFSMPSGNIDANYFPNTHPNTQATIFLATYSVFWAANFYSPDPALAWGVNFVGGDSNAYAKVINTYVRLVRGGQ